jgi:hypothetical protein
MFVCQHIFRTPALPCASMHVMPLPADLSGVCVCVCVCVCVRACVTLCVCECVCVCVCVHV